MHKHIGVLKILYGVGMCNDAPPGKINALLLERRMRFRPFNFRTLPFTSQATLQWLPF